MMKRTTSQTKLALIIGFVIVFGLNGIVTLSAYGHGGKTHGGEAFTAFQALEKASKLYDRLIVSGKLTEDWETDLKRVTIDIRNSNDKREYVVQFEKSKGEPSSVYFFFDQDPELIKVLI